MFSGSVDVIVHSSVRRDRLSLSEVSHNRERLAAAAQRLTETDATILRNISGSQLPRPSFNRAQEEFNKRKHIGSYSPLEKLDKTEFTRSFSYFNHNLRPPEEYSHIKQKHLRLLGSSVSVPARYSVPQEKDTDESISN